MKNKKKIIIYSIIGLLIIILIVSILLVKALKEEDSKYDEILESKEGIKSEDKNPISLIRTNNAVTYYTVDECIKSYFRMLEVEDSSVLMTYLNENYINKNNVNNNNILTVLEKYNDYNTYRTVEMYELANFSITTYYVKGRIDHQNVYFIVHLDLNNQTFDIEPTTEDFYDDRINNQNDVEEDDVQNIDKKVYNSYVYKDLNDEVTSKLYFADYIKTMLTDSEEAYNLLDKEYQNKRFSSIDEFNTYIQNNRNRFNISLEFEDKDISEYENFNEYYEFASKNEKFGLTSYLVEQFADYTRYICVDGYNNYFIFYVTYPGTYTVMLDSYTIDMEEFIEKYNSSTDEVKVGMNIQKIIEAINSKDYQYIYDKLDDTFRNNNYNTVNDLEEDIRNNLFDTNEVEYTNFYQEGNAYIYQLKFKDAQNPETNERNMTIIMNLKEETDFVMSFSIE